MVDANLIISLYNFIVFEIRDLIFFTLFHGVMEKEKKLFRYHSVGGHKLWFVATKIHDIKFINYFGLNIVVLCIILVDIQMQLTVPIKIST